MTALCTSYPQSEHGGVLGLKQGCRHLPATSINMGKLGIQQHLANLDTMSTLESDTLVSRAEPPPFEWTYITLGQTYKYCSM